jgi:hypothetical protein
MEPDGSSPHSQQLAFEVVPKDQFGSESSVYDS